MLNSMLELVAAYMPMWNYILDSLMLVMFVATVPVILRSIVRFNV